MNSLGCLVQVVHREDLHARGGHHGLGFVHVSSLASDDKLTTTTLITSHLQTEPAEPKPWKPKGVVLSVAHTRNCHLVWVERRALVRHAEVDEDVGVPGDLHDLGELDGEPRRLVQVRDGEDLEAAGGDQQLGLVHTRALQGGLG